MAELIQLTVSNAAGETGELLFSLGTTPVARKWRASLLQAAQLSQIRERRRWYNFPGHAQAEADFIIKEIGACVERINGEFPGLIPYSIDPASAQQSVNRIHTFFADTGLEKRFLTASAGDTWHDLNSWLHAYEACLRSREAAKSSGIPEANILVTWQDPFHQPLSDEDYTHFTMAKRFGVCYISYCQTGRHLYEMFLAQDAVATDEHILPLRRLSANTYIWLGSTTGPNSLKAREQAMASWFERHKERLNSLGFFWGDPKLALGWIPVAELYNPPPPAQQAAFLDRFARFDRVEMFQALFYEHTWSI